MFANVAHYTALYTNVVAKLGSDTSALLLSYGLYTYVFILGRGSSWVWLLPNS